MIKLEIGSSPFDVGLILQIITLIVAFFGPFVAYRYARKLAISGNRQAWLDALRDDVAHLVALKDHRMTLIRELKALPSIEIERRREINAELVNKSADLQAVRHRVRLRLRKGNLKHDRLIAAVEALAKAKADANRIPLRAEVVEAAEAVIQHTWGKIEQGE